ncbi:response regulator [Chloroflexota bacterium]
MDKRKILIADDETNIRALVKSMLGKDYIVIEASNGEEAVNITRSQKPDLVLMDIMMPKIDGYVACSKIKKDQATRAIPVVMVTGVDYGLNEELAMRIGADGYITKPFSLERMHSTINRLLEQHPGDDSRPG